MYDSEAGVFCCSIQGRQLQISDNNRDFEVIFFLSSVDLTAPVKTGCYFVSTYEMNTNICMRSGFLLIIQHYKLIFLKLFKDKQFALCKVTVFCYLFILLFFSGPPYCIFSSLDCTSMELSNGTPQEQKKYFQKRQERKKMLYEGFGKLSYK